MSRPSQSEVDTAVANLADAATCIRTAAALLDGVPRRFRDRVEDIDGTHAVDASLAVALTKLSGEIGMAAEYAAEMSL